MAENIDAERAALLPCPFCGGAAQIRDGSGWYGAGCDTLTAGIMCFGYCHARQYRSPAEAAACWNRRTPSASIGEDGLPELPEPDGSASVPVDESKFTFTEADAWSKPLVLQYAREAVAADRRAREEAHTAEMVQWARDNGLNVPPQWTKLGASAPQAAQGVKRWQDRLPSTHVPTTSDFVQARDEEIADLRAQLARQSQEPVAWLYKWIGAYGVRKPGDIIARTPAELGGHVDLHPRNWERLSPLYAAPPLSSEQQAEYREALEMCVKALEHAGLGKATREAALAAAQAVLAAPVAPSQTQTTLTPEELAFVELVRQRPGHKLNGGEALASDGRALWERPEQLGLIQAVGSYKWVAPGAAPQNPVVEAVDGTPVDSEGGHHD